MQIFQLNMAVKLINSYLITTFSSTFLLLCCKNSKHKSNQSAVLHKCSKCLPSAFTQARRCFLKFAIDLQIAYCGNSSQIFTNDDFSSGVFFGCRFIYKTEWCNCNVIVKL